MVIRVNIGGADYVDHCGERWAGDKAYHKDSWGCTNLPSTDVMETTDPISGTNDPVLFQTMRVGEHMTYRFDVPNGTYHVRILFAEIYWESSDAEQQDICIQGKKVLGNFNIFDEAGHDTAIEKSFTAKAAKGPIEVRFVGVSLPMHSGARACALERRQVKTVKK